MSKHKKHHVKTYHWHTGVLKTVEHYFDSMEEAMAHANRSNAPIVKVYNTDGELVHNIGATSGPSYA